MALIKTVSLCGLTCNVETNDDKEKESVSFVFPELTFEKGVRGSKEKEIKTVSIGKRSFNAVLDLFELVKDPASRAAISDGKLKELSPVLYKAVINSGNDPEEFYLSAGSIIAEMESEEENLSASNPNNIAARAIASVFTMEDTAESCNPQDLLQKFMEKLDMAEVKKLLSKFEELGRFDDGSLRTRKQKATSKAA
jgi:hypothetical protein